VGQLDIRPFSKHRVKTQAIDVAPFWRVVAPPADGAESIAEVGRTTRITIHPGAAFGDGTHETTQLCLQALAALAPRAAPGSGERYARNWRMLDFGAGSGILAIAAAKLGATVDAVEIDDHAIEETLTNARSNGVSDLIRCARSLEGCGTFDLIVANILCSVLLAFAEQLVSRLDRNGTLILSGLVSTDVPEIAARYGALLGTRRPEVYELNDWRALVWRSR